MTSSPQSASQWTERRAPERPEDGALNADTLNWLATLPSTVQPVLLAERYPRICNRLAERWQHPELSIPYFDDLLMDGRGGRQGFPMLIAIEIASLKEFFLDTLVAKKRDVWDHNFGRP